MNTRVYYAIGHECTHLQLWSQIGQGVVGEGVVGGLVGVTEAIIVLAVSIKKLYTIELSRLRST